MAKFRLEHKDGKTRVYDELGKELPHVHQVIFFHSSDFRDGEDPGPVLRITQNFYSPEIEVTIEGEGENLAISETKQVDETTIKDRVRTFRRYKEAPRIQLPEQPGFPIQFATSTSTERG